MLRSLSIILFLSFFAVLSACGGSSSGVENATAVDLNGQTDEEATEEATDDGLIDFSSWIDKTVSIYVEKNSIPVGNVRIFIYAADENEANFGDELWSGTTDSDGMAEGTISTNYDSLTVEFVAIKPFLYGPYTNEEDRDDSSASSIQILNLNDLDDLNLTLSDENPLL